MIKKLTKITSFILLASLFTFSLSACGHSGGADKKVLRIGTSPGPYSELFKTGVKPILEKEGYKVKLINFSNLLQADVALTEGSIDFNVDQHTAYIRTFNKEKKAHLVPVVHIPSVPAGIFSNKYKSIKQIKNGAKIAIPQDPSNAARAYNLLQKAGWITLKKGINPILATKDDIESNPRHLTITPMDSAQIPRALSDVDFGVLPGSIVYAAHIDPNKTLLAETLVKDLEITVAVDKKNQNKKWVKAIAAAYKSKAFQKYISDHNSNHYWVIPDDLK